MRRGKASAMAAGLGPGYGSAWLEPTSEPHVFTFPRTWPTGAEVKLDPQQTNYLVNVLRLAAGAPVLLFNGRDGEFSASLAASSRKAASLIVGARTRPQEAPPDVDYLFAPLKHARLDYMAQKAIEMGARRLRPVITRHTQVSRVNLERLASQRDRGLRTMRRDLDSGDCARRGAR